MLSYHWFEEAYGKMSEYSSIYRNQATMMLISALKKMECLSGWSNDPTCDGPSSSAPKKKRTCHFIWRSNMAPNPSYLPGWSFKLMWLSRRLWPIWVFAPRSQMNNVAGSDPWSINDPKFTRFVNGLQISNLLFSLAHIFFFFF